MNPALHRVLQAYRPMYLNGLLRDGQYRLPSSAESAPTQSPSVGSVPRRLGLLVALTGLQHPFGRQRRQP
ncbi:hypothetical protein [Dyella sp. A6]|uniref:hypothetical protein n=1 Tax=Dyella aluminiiresistens TaxID=3069105 RepID=UPI002E7A478C|nr:hypothetical protein [Dyella sp. A6]